MKYDLRIKIKIENKQLTMRCLIANEMHGIGFKEIQDEVYRCVRKNIILTLYSKLSQINVR